MSDWHTVHVRVNDAATGQSTPVRIRFESGGHTLAPFGRLEHFSVASGVDVGGHLLLDRQRFYYIDGTCEVRLPAGEVAVEVFKGPEFIPLRRVVCLAPGQISLRLAIQRWTDWRAKGWYSGDTHVLELSPHAALLEGAAEDVAVVNLLAYERESAFEPSVRCVPNILAFSGQVPALERPGHLVVVNTRNTHLSLGRLGLLNCHRAVYPLRLDDLEEDWALADLCDQCHRKKTGLVVWSGGFDPDALRVCSRSLPTPPPSPLPEAERGSQAGYPAFLPLSASGRGLGGGVLEQTLTGFHGERLADLILGKIDAFEIGFFETPEPRDLSDWNKLLAAGLRIPLVGGSLKDSNAVALGRVRTYAHLGAGKSLSCADWIEAVRAGRTFATNGPLLRLSVGDAEPGIVLKVEAGRRLPLRAEAQSAVPFRHLELLVNGSVVAAAEACANGLSAAVEAEWEADRSAWVVARCWDEQQLPDRQCVFAQTSPVYVEVQGRPFVPEASVVESLLSDLDEEAGWVARAAPQRQHLLSVFSSARQQLLRGKPDDG